MQSADKDCSGWLIQKLETQLATFDENTKALLQGQKQAFNTYYELLHEDPGNKQRSKNSRSLRRKARELLGDIFKTLGLEVFFLCTLEPNITRLGANAPYIRLATIQNWWDTAHQPQGLARVAKDLCGDSISSIFPKSQKRRFSEGPGANEDVLSGAQAPNHSLPVSLPEDVLQIIARGALEGVAEVFNERMFNAIRRVTVDGESKAAITMSFPRWVGPVNCVMGLDICESDIAQLAMALFHAEVTWVGQTLHIILENGVSLTTKTSEVTLKGVEDRAISEVFGSEIHNAINECLVRKAETRSATECVSMIFTENGAFINLSLGIRAGLELQKKLCT
ncbi:hypothetical protein DM02DRAFT_676772 [Periconia macrospinosa]|uniref:Uncharacterized protein n=1 Tax=Periconia macrospinosa TaxID=97972 RepID=A0A2V1D6A5_9PLEO|nr:hypothetical protein DM02DRAFT_676772 [Periconia macrospinosa]